MAANTNLSYEEENNMKKTNTGTAIRKMICTAMVMVWMLIAAVPAFAAPKIKAAEYEGNGRVEVDFSSKVKYKNVKVSVKDNKGASYSVKINEKDNDDLTFTIKNYKAGRTYTYTISGVRKSKEKTYGKVTGKVTIPAASGTPRVKKTDYDRKDKELEFDFASDVQWKNAKVVITDGKKNYSVRILEKDKDSIEVKVSGLKVGSKYNYKISGVRVKGTSVYQTISGTFVARDN